MYTPIQLEIIKTFWSKELSKWLIIWKERISEIIAIDYEREWFYRMIDDWENTFSWSIKWAEILWHIPHLEDVFRVAKEKWYLVEVDIFKSSFTKEYIHDFLFWKNWDNHSIRIFPEISILNQPESVLIELLTKLKW